MSPSKQNMTDISNFEFDLDYDNTDIDGRGLSRCIKLSSRNKIIQGESTTLTLTKILPRKFECSTCINKCDFQNPYDYDSDIECVEHEFDIECNGRTKNITKGFKLPREFTLIGPSHPYYDNKSEFRENVNEEVLMNGASFTFVCHDCIRYMDTNEKYRFNSGKICQICGDSEFILDTVDLKDESLPEACKDYYERYWSDWWKMEAWDELPCTGPIKMMPWTYDEFPEVKKQLRCGRECNRMSIKCNTVCFKLNENGESSQFFPPVAIDVCSDRLKSFMHSVYIHAYKNVKWKCSDFLKKIGVACTCANGVQFVETFYEEFDKLHDKHVNLVQELVGWAWSPHGVRGCEHIQEMNDKYK